AIGDGMPRRASADIAPCASCTRRSSTTHLRCCAPFAPRSRAEITAPPDRSCCAGCPVLLCRIYVQDRRILGGRPPASTWNSCTTAELLHNSTRRGGGAEPLACKPCRRQRTPSDRCSSRS